MLTRWNDLDRFFPALDDVRRRMDDLWDYMDAETHARAGVDAWPRAQLADDGEAYMLTAEIPGMTEKDVSVTVHQDLVTVSGERRVTTPEGYEVLRRDRPATRFSRSVALPTRVDAEKVTAVVKNGQLQVHLPKVAEARPFQVSVRAA